MSTTAWIILLIAALAVGFLIAWLVGNTRRTSRLRERFGPEYGRAVHEHGDVKQAEADLARRAERVEQLHIRPLSATERDRFGRAWREVQASFVDDPRAAIQRADQQVSEVMQARGYPVGDFDQRAADISVDHPEVVQNYRAAHEIAERDRRGDADTEDLRRGMMYYRDLFDELLEVPADQRTEARR